MSAVLDLFFPPKCAFCGKLLDEAGEICTGCAGALPFRAEGDALFTVGEAGYRTAVAFYYDGVVQSGIRAFKFGGKSWRARPFARYLAQAASEQLGGCFDRVTYVPVSWQRNFSRGFDQARLLAEETADIWGVRAESVLRKIRHTRAQSSLNDKSLRERNARSVYTVPHPERVRGGKFLLIDDVCTTGSTLASAADALREAGAAGVVCAALAGGHGKVEEPVRSVSTIW